MTSSSTSRATDPASRCVDALTSADLVQPGRRDEAHAVLAGVLSPPPARDRSPGRATELVGYLGGALVASAVLVLVAEEWGSLDAAVQVLLLVGAGLATGTAGWLSAAAGGGRGELLSGADGARRRLASTLLALTAWAWAGAVGTTVDAVSSSAHLPALAGFASAALLAAAAYAAVPGLVGQATAAAASAALVLVLADLVDGAAASTAVTVVGLAALGLLWVALVERGVWREGTAARAAAAGLVLVAAQSPLWSWERDYSAVAYALTALAVVGLLAAYLRTAAWPYLAGALVGFTVLVPEMVFDLTGGAVGAAAALLATGVAALAASLLGWRLHARAET